MALEMYKQNVDNHSGSHEIFKTVCVQNNMALEVSNTDVIYEALTTFEDMGLDPEIIRGLKDMNILRPSLIQANIFPYIFSDNPRDIIAQSQSGTGKTISYIIVALQVVDFSISKTQVLVITPTFELSLQVYDKMRIMAKYLPQLKIDLAIKDNQSFHKGSAHIVVGCAGTILKWIQHYQCLDLSSCHFILMDEVDCIINQHNQYNQFTTIMKKISHTCLHVFVSATFTDQSFGIAKRIMNNPMCIRLKPEQLALDNIHQYYCHGWSDEEKVKMVCKIIKIPDVEKIIVFCNQRNDAMNIGKKLQSMGICSLTLTGDMKPECRSKSFEEFRAKLKYSVLICTDVCSRGIDINTVNTVVNYHIPRDKSNPDLHSYYHRIGRSGRFGKQSISFTLLSSMEELEFIKQLENHYQIQIPEIKILDSNFDSTMHSLTKISNRDYVSLNNFKNLSIL